jgi:hypothetical protein
MARNWYGDKRLIREDLYTKKRVTHSEVRDEYWKIVLWLLGGYLYFHFIMMGWGI